MIRPISWPHAVVPTLLLLPCLLLACSDGESTAPRATGTPAAADSAPAKGDPTPGAPAAAEPTQAELYDRGRSVYMGNCTACHNMNPSQIGSLGPPVEGASRALLQARVIDGTYPPGYTPKRDTKLMVALPHLADDIDALTVFLSGKK